jgi:hypothetical protein
MVGRTITPEDVRAINARMFDFPGEDKELLNLKKVIDCLKYFESAITHALADISDGEEKRKYESKSRRRMLGLFRS